MVTGRLNFQTGTKHDKCHKKLRKRGIGISSKLWPLYRMVKSIIFYGFGCILIQSIIDDFQSGKHEIIEERVSRCYFEGTINHGGMFDLPLFFKSSWFRSFHSSVAPWFCFSVFAIEKVYWCLWEST